MRKIMIFLILFLCFTAAIAETSFKIIVKSNAFENNGFIPAKYTCDGENISPEICWEIDTKNIKKIKSYVLISDDPDAPMGTWVHWVVYDIPANMSCLFEGFPKARIIKSIKQGKTGFGDFGYGGPCPPSGIHRYYFKIYALDIQTLNLLPDKANKKSVLSKIKKHIIGYGELIGKYKRK